MIVIFDRNNNNIAVTDEIITAIELLRKNDGSRFEVVDVTVFDFEELPVWKVRFENEASARKVKSPTIFNKVVDETTVYVQAENSRDAVFFAREMKCTFDNIKKYGGI